MKCIIHISSLGANRKRGKLYSFMAAATNHIEAKCMIQTAGESKLYAKLFGPVTKCDFDLLWIKAFSETFFALPLTLTYPNALL